MAAVLLVIVPVTQTLPRAPDNLRTNLVYAPIDLFHFRWTGPH